MYRGSRFAFGYDVVDDVPCPAQATGRTNKHGAPAFGVAKLYDTILSTEHGMMEGVVEEETAKDAWMKAIQKAEDAGGMSEESIEDARNVSKQLGWVD